MWAHDRSAQMHSPLGSNNQQGGDGASQTSDNAANNQSPQGRCCCKPVEALACSAPTEPSCHVPACPSCETASEGNIPPAILDTEGSTQLFHQGGCEVRTPITQQFCKHPKNCYKTLSS